MYLRQDRGSRVSVPRFVRTVAPTVVLCCWWLVPAAAAQPRDAVLTDLPVVFSVDVNAEGLFQPDPAHPTPNDVFAVFTTGGAGGWTFLSEGELFQSSGVNLGFGPDQTNLDRMSAALGIGPAPLGPPPYTGPFSPNTGAPNLTPNPPVGPGSVGLVPGDNINALSFGEDGGCVLLFSVDPGAAGMPGTAVNTQAVLSPFLGCIGSPPSNGGGDPVTGGNEAAGDIFVSPNIGNFGGAMTFGGLTPAPPFSNNLWCDELWLGLQAPANTCGLGPPEDDLDALEVSGPNSGANVVDGDMDGIPDQDRPVFFALDPASATVTAPTADPYPGACTGADPNGVTPDDILVSGPLTGPGVPQLAFAIYARGIQDIGLLAGDDIDALVLYDTDGAGGPPDGILTAGQDSALFSLAAGSPSLTAGGFSPADVFITNFAGSFAMGVQWPNLGLQVTDELNALDIGWWFPPQDHPGGKNHEHFPGSKAKLTVDASTPGYGIETIRLEGPADIEVDLTSLADADTDGLDEVTTQMIDLNLTGSSVLWGTVDVRLNPTFTTVGKIEETVNITPGYLDIPPFTATGTATSFFDVYYEMEVGFSPDTYYNPSGSPAHMATPKISRKRPKPEDPAYKDPYWIELDGPGGPAAIYIGDETHHPHPPPPDPHGPGPGTLGELTLPADFFGPGSDPFDGGVVAMEGGLINPFEYGDAATLHQRWGVPIGPDDTVGTNGTVDLEIIGLNLVSVAPITVTYNGGLDPEDWDVIVSLSEVHGVEVDPASNYLTATKTHANGGTFDTSVEVQPKFTFTKVGDPAEKRTLDAGLEERPPMVFTSTGTPWVHQVSPHLNILAPDDGMFVPMVEETVPGDPASQVAVEMTAYSDAPAQNVMRPAAGDTCISLEQFADFVTCMDGPMGAVPWAVECGWCDGNDSGHVDLGDFALVQNHICLPTPPPPGDDCGSPIVVNLPADLPFADLNTTCGHLDDYSATCLGAYDGGEDIIYELTVTEAVTVDILLQSLGILDTGMAIDTVCPPGDPCMDFSTSNPPIPHGFEGMSLDTGDYYLMIDNWPGPPCYEFTLTIEASGYCDAWGGDDEYISSVMVGAINNPSGYSGYADYTYLWTVMDIGTGYPIVVSSGMGYPQDYCGVWVDWNQDLDFEDAGEAIAMVPNPSPGPYTGTITPPVSAALGDTRMRIRIARDVPPDPCGDTVQGEVEDYTVSVTDIP